MEYLENDKYFSMFAFVNGELWLENKAGPDQKTVSLPAECWVKSNFKEIKGHSLTPNKSRIGFDSDSEKTRMNCLHIYIKSQNSQSTVSLKKEFISRFQKKY